MSGFMQICRSLQEKPTDAAIDRLSNLIDEELEQLAQAWPTWEAERRHEIITRMAENAEADFELDFSRVMIMALQDSDARVRAAAIEGLWENEDFRLVRLLIRMLKQDGSALVRAAAAVSLSRFALLTELGKLAAPLDEQIWDSLWQTIHDPREDVDVRRRAVESLAYFDRPSVAQVIEQAFQDDDLRMRVSAVFAMGRSADDIWSEQVLQQIASPDAEMRYEAVRACGALCIAEAIPQLSRLVADPDPEVQHMAIWSLGQIGGPEARRILQICLEQGNEAIQDAADEALAEMDFLQGALDFSLYDLDDEQDNEWGAEDDQD